MKTAMESAPQEQDDRLALTRLVDAQQRFTKRWKPEDPYYQDEFTRELLYLIHLVYREAQAPLTKQLTEWVMRHPTPLFISR